MRKEPSAWGWKAGGAAGICIACAWLAALSVLLAAPVRGQERQDQSATAPSQTPGETDPHAAHRAMLQSPSYQVVDADYAVPDVTLRDQQGHAIPLRQLLSGDRSVAVNFIYTSCTTVCPVMTATMLQMQRKLNDSALKPLFVSISIDPDFDTAARLGAYADRFGADWTFLTGERVDVLDVLRAFSAWRGNKSNHAAITLFRPAGAKRWTRVEGLASAAELVDVWNSDVT
jgi:protein SCO1/2